MMIIQDEEAIELNKRSHRRPPRQLPVRPPRLSFCAYIFWTVCSFVGSLLIGIGYWLPYWIRGTLHQVIDVSFGSFRRCNYPTLDEQGRIQIVFECGRYRTFEDIPSFAWKVSTILIGLGAASSLLVAFILFFAFCMPHSLRSTNARVLVNFQLVSFLLVLSGCALYPLGWGNQEVRDVCGTKTMAYEIGTCSLSDSAYMMGIGLLFLLFCLILGLISVRKIRRQSEKQYNNLVILDR